jgi:hypothetical protein
MRDPHDEEVEDDAINVQQGSVQATGFISGQIEGGATPADSVREWHLKQGERINRAFREVASRCL